MIRLEYLLMQPCSSIQIYSSYYFTGIISGHSKFRLLMPIIKDRNGESPLHIAINSGCDEIASLLIGQADLMGCDGQGRNPLHLAVRAGNSALVRQLLQKDRRMINIVTREGLAPLHIASRWV